MFYEGDLQAGIDKAVQDDKLVVCFVTDDGEESQLWENELLQQDPLKLLLASQTVVLRLKAGSEEAGFLAAIFPLPKTPTLVIIKNGELKEYITAGVSNAQFNSRVYSALQIPTASQVDDGQSAHPESPPRSNLPTAIHHAGHIQRPDGQASELLKERNSRLEAQKEKKESEEKEKSAVERTARQDAPEGTIPPVPRSGADAKYATMQKKRQQEAREERARILKRVEDDKAERKEREAARKADAKVKIDNVAPKTVESSIRPSSSRWSAECGLQIRLFDGSTIKSRFPSSGSLRKDVRPFVDEKQVGDAPYTFKQVLSPLPNKNIETSEEEESLQSLGLTPNATLILLPVNEYTSAYDNGTPGLFHRGAAAGYSLISTGLGLFGSFLGSGVHSTEVEPPIAAPSVGPQQGASTGIRMLRDHDTRREDQQFYNGNALNFEPRKDDDGKKDD